MGGTPILATLIVGRRKKSLRPPLVGKPPSFFSNDISTRSLPTIQTEKGTEQCKGARRSGARPSVRMGDYYEWIAPILATGMVAISNGWNSSSGNRDGCHYEWF